MKIDFEIAILILLITNLSWFLFFSYMRRSLKASVYTLGKEKEELIEKFEKNKKEVLTLDAKDLLADLCRGKAVIKITPIDPKYIFEYSPRG